MGGKPIERLSLGLLFILVLLLSHCANQKAPTKKPPPPHNTAGVYHVVERHQTFYRICKTYGVDLQEVASLNRIADPGRIQAGQRIFIPGAKRVLKVEIYIDDVVSEHSEKDRIAYKKLDFIWPVEGRINQGFEEAENKAHQGIDISSGIGAPIKASNAGMVIYSNNSIKGYGNLIIVRHSEDLVTVYAHNQVNLVEEGMRGEGANDRNSGPDRKDLRTSPPFRNSKK